MTKITLAVMLHETNDYSPENRLHLVQANTVKGVLNAFRTALQEDVKASKRQFTNHFVEIKTIGCSVGVHEEICEKVNLLKRTTGL